VILDTSAIVGILQHEAEAPALAAAIEGADTVKTSVASVLEASLVLGPGRQDVLDDAELVEVDARQLSTARAAHLRYGRGSGSQARLNFGDCFSYALAMTLGEALLYKGDDFGHTDVTSARAG
jgi:ribonuclease VapC